MSDAEVVSLVALMHSAGYGTTKRLIGNGLALLLRHPDQADALRVDPSLDRAATDEVLRDDASVMTVAYFAGDGAEVEGRSLVPGSLCTIVLGAANRDPRVFAAPGAFDVTCERTAAPLSFGYGAHYCLGAALAKMETDVALGPLLRRYPNMELVAEPQRHLPSARARMTLSRSFSTRGARATCDSKERSPSSPAPVRGPARDSVSVAPRLCGSRRKVPAYCSSTATAPHWPRRSR